MSNLTVEGNSYVPKNQQLLTAFLLFISLIFSLSVYAQVNVDVRVGHGNDDAEERASNGAMLLNSSDLEFMDNTGDHGYQSHVGIRFRNSITIPQGYTITNAYIEFTVDESGPTVATNLNNYCENSGNSLVFNSTSGNISARSLTTATIPWNGLPQWTPNNSKINTPDLRSIIQEVVNRPDWAPGNALTFIVTGTGKRVADSYNNGTTSKRPRLVITSSVPLPIELSYFLAKEKHEEVELTWETISENNNDYFTIERSADLLSWEEVSTHDAIGTSLEMNNYKALDRSPLNGVSYYRLKQTDLNGKFEYFHPVSVRLESDEFDLSVYPNPLTSEDKLNVLISGMRGETVQISIANETGQVVHSVVYDIQSELEKINLENTTKLVPGVYYVSVISSHDMLRKRVVVIN